MGTFLTKSNSLELLFFAKKRPQSGEDIEVFKYLVEFFDTFNRESKKE